MSAPFQISPAQPHEQVRPGRFFRLMEADGPVEVRYYLRGKEVARAESVRAGYAEMFTALEGFDKFVITSATTQTIQYADRLESTVSYDTPPIGQSEIVNVVSVAPSQTVTGTQAAKVVTNASGLLLAAMAGRTYLFIQNKSDTGTVWLNILGAAAAQGSGIRLEPGESFVMEGTRVSAAAIYALGDIANNPDVVAVELQ
jgi:hypothetical protein